MGLIVLIIPIVLLLAFVHSGYRHNRSIDMINQWARIHGYRVMSAEKRTMLRGPFSFTTGKNQTVYRVHFMSPSGRTQPAWVRCGGWFGGISWSDRVTVRWEN